MIQPERGAREGMSGAKLLTLGLVAAVVALAFYLGAERHHTDQESWNEIQRVLGIVEKVPLRGDTHAEVQAYLDSIVETLDTWVTVELGDRVDDLPKEPRWIPERVPTPFPDSAGP